MIDVELMAATLRAVAPGTALVVVGDAHQLPSVGPGSVLRDLCVCGLPTVELTEVRRNAGRIVRACHAIKDGRVPAPASRVDLSDGSEDNWVHIEIDDPEAIAAEIVERHESVRRKAEAARAEGRAPAFDPVWDMQVVTPQRARLPIACENLNALLSARLNPKAALAAGVGGFGDTAEDARRPPFSVGDKVIRTKNGEADEMTAPPEGGRVDWHWGGGRWAFAPCEVVNGDMGTVMDVVIDPDAGEAWVVARLRNPDRLVRLPYGDSHLQQAYAITCHKAQGSGFPYVIVPVHHSFYWDDRAKRGLFNREWIYTAISRSEKLLVTIGQSDAIRAAVGRPTVHRRRTRLVEFYRSMNPSPVQVQTFPRPDVPAITALPTPTPEAAHVG
jgi:exodeoxyribonuclease V alpha subunit